MKNRYALVLAGGSGTRMGMGIPKQFLMLGNRPLLMHTLEVFSRVKLEKILLTLPESQMNEWKRLCEEFQFESKIDLVPGGETRFHSVRNGLNQLTGEGFVAIHDGVRPFISKEIIEESFRVAELKGNAVAAVRLKDSIRESLLTGGTRNVNRNNYYLIQTPQTFDLNQIRSAYNHATHFNFTDDAGVLEESGEHIHLLEGDYRNMKITTPEDLEIASILMKRK